MRKTLYIPIDTTLDNTVECDKLIKRGDTLTLTIKVFTDGVLADLTGQLIDIILKKSDNSLIEKTIDSSNISNGVVTVTLEQQATLASGLVSGELQIYTEGTLTTTNTFTYEVSTSFADNIIEVSQNDIQVLSELKTLIADGQVTIAEYEDNILAIANSIEAIEALANIKSYIDTNLLALENANAQAVVNIANETTQNDEAVQNISDLTSKNATATSNISALDLKNATATTNINSLDSKNGLASSNISSLDTKNGIATTNISNLDSKNTTASSNITNLDFENDRAETNIEALESFGDATTLLADTTALKSEIETARGGKVNLDTRLDEIDTNLSEVINGTKTGDILTVSNVKKYSNKKNDGLSYNQINMESSSEIENLSIATSNAAGINVQASSKKVNFKNNNVNSVGIAFNINSSGVENVAIEKNIFTTNDYGVLLNASSTNGKNLLIQGNKIITNGADGIELNLPNEDNTLVFRGVKIIGNNIFVGDTDYGTVKGFGIGIAEGQDVVVLGNVVEQSRLEALHIEDVGENISIIANVFNDCKTNGAVIYDRMRTIGIYSKLLIINGNHFKKYQNLKTDTGILIAYDANGLALSGLNLANNRIEGFNIGLQLSGDVRKSLVTFVDGLLIENCNVGVKTRHSLQGSIICKNVSKLLDIERDCTIDKITSLTRINENDLFTNSITLGFANIRSFYYPLNSKSLTPSATVNVPLFKTPKYFSGKLKLKVYDTNGTGYYFTYYDVKFDGTTLTGATKIHQDSALGVSDFTLINESGYIKVKIYSANISSADITIDFCGDYIIDKTII